MEQNKPKAVLLDNDGTLVKTWTTEPLPGVYGILRRLEQEGYPLEVLTNQAGPAYWQAYMDKPDVPMPQDFPSFARLAKNLGDITRTLSLEKARWIISMYDKRVGNVIAPLAPSKDSPDFQAISEVLLTRSREDILFSFFARIQHEMLQALAREETMKHVQVTVSVAPRFRKPEPEMLLFAATELGVLPGECVYVGDMETDREAATRAGMAYCLSMQALAELLWEEK